MPARGVYSAKGHTAVLRGILSGRSSDTLPVATMSTYARYGFYAFLCAHLIIWTLAPSLSRHNLPLDVAEGTIWAHQLMWGYDKDPLLNAWLTALAIYFGGSADWVLYLFSQLSVSMCLVFIWRLARIMLPPWQALLSVVCLEGVLYYNIHAIDFNDNVLQFGLWAGASYFYYLALTKRYSWAWLLTACCLALGVLAKYYTLALVASMGIFLLCSVENRQYFATKMPYIAAGCFILLLVPHAVWLYHHHFITIAYVVQRVQTTSLIWYDRFFFLLDFVYCQLKVILPALLLLAIVRGTTVGHYNTHTTNTHVARIFDQQFVWLVGFGPLLLSLLFIVILGRPMNGGWGTPLFSFLGIGCIMLLNPILQLRYMMWLTGSVIIMMLITAVAYGFVTCCPGWLMRANFPGREISTALTGFWRHRYQQPLAYLAGPRWLAGSISFYSTDRPQTWVDWNSQYAPWIDLKTMQQQGAIFLWDATKQAALPSTVENRFPLLTAPIIWSVPSCHDHQHRLSNFKLGIALLMPMSQQATPVHATAEQLEQYLAKVRFNC